MSWVVAIVLIALEGPRQDSAIARSVAAMAMIWQVERHIDPQTGHYVAELAADPAYLTVPAIYKGIDNAVAGFNSAIATVSFGYRPIDTGGQVSVGLGDNSLNFQALRLAHTVDSRGGNEYAAALSLARSEGDGSVDFGDHEFARYNLQLQRSTAGTQSDLLVAYQDKFYGWPGAYTGFATLPETDDTQTTLIAANHRHNTDRGWWEIGGFSRRLVDDYDFDRRTVESGAPGSFDHETKVIGLGFQGYYETGRVAWRYGAQLTSDELVRSTDLTNGTFKERDYATLTVVPEVLLDLDNGSSVELRAGATLDYSDRGGSAGSPLAGVVLRVPSSAGVTEYGLEYAATSQLPGYTVLNSNPSGLFGGNASLGRERSRQLALSIAHEAGEWHGRAVLFSREDERLVDWTYARGAPFARQANAVDLDVVGFEGFVSHSRGTIDLAAGYTWLDKDPDYGSAAVDASFYALNFARHRLTLALNYRFAEQFELRFDTEYRRQEDNPLRVGDDSTYLASASLAWNAVAGSGFSALLIVDNLTDSEFQPFPGTPAAGRQYSLRASYAW